MDGLAQVERIATGNSLRPRQVQIHPRIDKKKSGFGLEKNILHFVSAMIESRGPSRTQVKIPGTLVDGLVVARAENHWMAYVTPYNAGHASEIKAAMDMHPLTMDERKVRVLQSLCARENPPSCTQNSNEAWRLEFFTLKVARARPPRRIRIKLYLP